MSLFTVIGFNKEKGSDKKILVIGIKAANKEDAVTKAHEFTPILGTVVDVVKGVKYFLDHPQEST